MPKAENTLVLSSLERYKTFKGSRKLLSCLIPHFCLTNPVCEPFKGLGGSSDTLLPDTQWGSSAHYLKEHLFAVKLRPTLGQNSQSLASSASS